jgi:Na+/proline symporter
MIVTNFLLPLGSKKRSQRRIRSALTRTPFAVSIYVVAGGLRATFIVDFLHTVILFVILYIFLFSIYGTSDVVGSPGAMYDLLKKAADLAPAAGNAAGSYMTMKSNGGILFGGCTIGASSTSLSSRRCS